MGDLGQLIEDYERDYARLETVIADANFVFHKVFANRFQGGARSIRIKALILRFRIFVAGKTGCGNAQNRE